VSKANAVEYKIFTEKMQMDLQKQWHRKVLNKYSQKAQKWCHSRGLSIFVEAGPDQVFCDNFALLFKLQFQDPDPKKTFFPSLSFFWF